MKNLMIRISRVRIYWKSLNEERDCLPQTPSFFFQKHSTDWFSDDKGR